MIGMTHHGEGGRQHHGEEPQEEHPAEADAGIAFEPVLTLGQEGGRGPVAGQKDPLPSEQYRHGFLAMIGRIAHQDFNGASG